MQLRMRKCSNFNFCSTYPAPPLFHHQLAEMGKRNSKLTLSAEEVEELSQQTHCESKTADPAYMLNFLSPPSTVSEEEVNTW